MLLTCEKQEKFTQLDSNTQRRLKELESKVLMTSSFRAAWVKLLTDNERKELGPNAENCWQRIPNLVQLWMELKGVSQLRAIADVAYELSFILTPEHDRLLHQIGEQEQAPELPPKPVWDAAKRELRYRGRVVRSIRGESVSKNISSILDAFQEDGWPARIPHSLDVSVTPQPVHDAVRSLNRNLSEIRFHVDGDYIYWNGGATVQSSSSHRH